ncbi:MAG TPA: ISAzo13 family transposase, partial [Gammaproteobacteria bacterium]|nr:ISAzo13 family transposase [Gammaproteobacteria bacterium]
MISADEKLKEKLSVLLPALNEKQRRLLLGAEAIALGYGGIKYLSDITGMSTNTIARGIREFETGDEDVSRVRKKGSGRKNLTRKFPQLEHCIEAIIEPDTRGDPESPLRWTCKSVRNISDYLGEQGYSVSRQTVARILHKMEFSLQGNRKTKEGKDHPDRDKQFRFINSMCKRFLSKGDPVISVDTKKKELVGEYKNAGREWHKKGGAIEVNGHDFPDPKVSKAIPYGIYDIGNDSGWVNVGITADTAEFAVSSISHWWKYVGSHRYSDSKKLLICADAGGSNGYRLRLWKRELQQLVDTCEIEISVCHFPPGTSKWNKIEHRLFSFISLNWRGKPLTSYQ